VPKNILLFLLLAAAPVFSVPALPEFTLSAGGGLSLEGHFTRYSVSAREITREGPVDFKSTQEMDQLNFGGWLFLDAVYAELILDIQGGPNRYKETMKGSTGSSYTDVTREGTGSEITLGFNLLGKYPFRLREGLFLYPLAGIEYRIALMEKRGPRGGSESDRTLGKDEFDSGREYPLSLWNSLLVDIGAGLDFAFHSPFYIKTELLYGVRLPTPYENAALDFMEENYGISRPSLFGGGSNKMSGLSGGPELRIALGYRFYKPGT
jgi:hypothetical protein